MPVIAAFFGMIVRVFHSDHNPPHIHVQYGEFEAIIEIKTGIVLGGKLPVRLARIVKGWLKMHKKDVLKAWNDAMAHRMPRRVKGF